MKCVGGSGTNQSYVQLTLVVLSPTWHWWFDTHLKIHHLQPRLNMGGQRRIFNYSVNGHVSMKSVLYKQSTNS